MSIVTPNVVVPPSLQALQIVCDVLWTVHECVSIMDINEVYLSNFVNDLKNYINKHAMYNSKESH